MAKTLANTLSLLFHPLFMPSYGIILMINYGNYFSFLPSDYKWFIYAIVWVFTLGFPLLMIFMYKKLGRISSFNMPLHKERVMPMAMVLLSYVAAIFLLYKLRVPTVILNYFIGSAAVLLVLALVSYWWKISAHMAGVGGFIAASIVLGLYLKLNTSFMVVLFFLIAGYVGWSRLYLQAHSNMQLLAGFLTGFLIIILFSIGIV